MKDRVASSSMAGIKTATHAVDANNDGTPPLSFMYKDLKRFQGMSCNSRKMNWIQI